MFDRRIEGHAAVDHAAHQIDAAAGTVGLQSCFHVSRAGRGTKPAVDAVEQEFVVNVRLGGNERQCGANCSGHTLILRFVDSTFSREGSGSDTSAPAGALVSLPLPSRLNDKPSRVEDVPRVEFALHRPHQSEVTAGLTPNL